MAGGRGHLYGGTKLRAYSTGKLLPRGPLSCRASLYLLSGKVLVRSLSVGNTTVELRQIAVAARDESQRRPWRGRMP
jgi:hypothetical protein